MAVVVLPAGFTREVVSADGVPCEWLIPENSPKDRVLLYLHGGGFVYGWTSAHRRMVAYVARLAGIRALAVNYRLAPEHPFPAALEDSVASYRWLLRQGVAPQKIVIAGDSAGGNLTLATLLKLRDSREPLPAAAVCLSPVADLTERDEVFQGVYDALLHPKAARSYRMAYVANNDARDPLISPLFADLRGLPPILIHAGEAEFLRVDAVRLEEMAKREGFPIQVKIFPRMWHVWQINLSLLPQAVESLQGIAEFIKAHVGEGVSEGHEGSA